MEKGVMGRTLLTKLWKLLTKKGAKDPDRHFCYHFFGPSLPPPQKMPVYRLGIQVSIYGSGWAFDTSIFSHQAGPGPRCLD